jgi:hypothetical protein
MTFRSQGVQFIEANPVTAALDERKRVRADQDAADLQNAVGQASLYRTVGMAPLEMKKAQTDADAGALDLDTKRRTQQATIDTATAGAKKAGADADVSFRTVQPRIDQEHSQAARAKTDAGRSALDLDTETKTQGATIATANAQAAAAGSNARAASANADQAQAWKEQQFMDFAIKDPDYAEAWAAQNGLAVPEEMRGLIRNKRFTSVIAGLNDALKERYPGDENILQRNKEFDRIMRQMAGDTTPTDAEAIAMIDTTATPAIAPAAKGAEDIVTLYDKGGMPKSMRKNDPAIDQMLAEGWTTAAPKSGKILAQTGTDSEGKPVFEFVDGAPKLTEDQSKAMNFAARMEASAPTIDKFEQQGKDWIAKAAQNNIPFNLGNYLQTPEYQQYWQAKEDFMRAVLRKESGAVISNEEMAGGDKQYFPQPGDGPDVIAQKRQNRRVALEAMKSASGPGATLIPGIINRATNPNPAPPAGVTPASPTATRSTAASPKYEPIPNAPMDGSGPTIQPIPNAPMDGSGPKITPIPNAPFDPSQMSDDDLMKALTQ